MDNDNKPVGRFDKSKTPTVEREHIEKVISGTAKVRTNNARKLADTFFAEDMGTVKKHLCEDVLVPGLKKLIVSLIKDGVDIFFNGRVTRNDKRDRFAGDYVSYNTSFSDTRRVESVRTPSRFSYDDIVFENRVDAQAALDYMCDLIRKYGYVTVSEMYEMVERTAPFTANNYGWINLSNATIDRVYGGYVINVPRAMPLER
jgi:hypothetical protein